jgi:DNA polymerase III epsilon subunit-like protein
MQALVLDTETTGLVQNRSISLDQQPEIIEISAHLVNLKSGKLMSEYDTLIKPTIYPMTAQTIKETKTKLSNEMLKDAKTFKDLAPKIKKLLEEAPNVIAHNCAFDTEMFDIEFERLGQTVKWPNRICTVEQSIHLKGKRLNLTALHVEMTGKPFDDAHRAKSDVQALTRCAIAMYKKGLL